MECMDSSGPYEADYVRLEIEADNRLAEPYLCLHVSLSEATKDRSRSTIYLISGRTRELMSKLCCSEMIKSKPLQMLCDSTSCQ